MKAFLKGLFSLFLFLSFGQAVMAQEEVVEPLESSDNPVWELMIDEVPHSSLENVTFIMQVAPQIVQINDLVNYYFQIQNRGVQPVENVRMTHVLPRGMSFVGIDLADANVSLETTNYIHDTLILRGLYLESMMQEPFVYHAQAMVSEMLPEGIVKNQATLDVVGSVLEDPILSDASPATSLQDDQTVLVVNNDQSPVSTSEVSAITQQSVSPAVIRSSSGSGKKGKRWAGMKREDLLKGGIGATAAQSQAFSDRINQGQAAQVKTYVDRNGKTKLYSIIPGKLPASKFSTAIKSRPTYRASRKSRTSSKLEIRQTIPLAEKRRRYAQSYSSTKKVARGRFRGSLTPRIR